VTRSCSLAGVKSLVSRWRSRVNGSMHFAPFAALGFIITCMTSTFRGRLQGSTIQNGCPGLSVASFGFSQQQAQIVNQSRKIARGHPSLDLLIHHPEGEANHWASDERRAPARTIHRKPLFTSRRLCVRCLAPSGNKIKYGATKAHSSSLTSVE
jgi:hypothetical protein